MRPLLREVFIVSLIHYVLAVMLAETLTSRRRIALRQTLKTGSDKDHDINTKDWIKADLDNR